MACGSCGGNKLSRSVKEVGKAVSAGSNLLKAAVQQPDAVKWFKDGVTGLLKCLEGVTIYSDKEIIANRDVCRACEFSTKTDGKLTASSQCTATDPKTGAPCMCFVLCKTQVDVCPLGKFTNLTVNRSPVQESP